MDNFEDWKTIDRSEKKSRDGLHVIFRRQLELKLPIVDILNAYPLVAPKRKDKKN